MLHLHLYFVSYIHSYSIQIYIVFTQTNGKIIEGFLGIASGWHLHCSLGLWSFTSKDRTEFSTGRTESSGPASANPKHTSDSDVPRVSSKPLRCLRIEKTKKEGKWLDILSVGYGGFSKRIRLNFQLFLKTRVVYLLILEIISCAFSPVVLTIYRKGCRM